MKKRGLILFAASALLLCSCGTTYKYTSTSSEGGDSAETKMTLVLKNKKDGAGEFTTTTKSKAVYADGIDGFLGLGSIDGKLEINTSGKEYGTWEATDDGAKLLTTKMEVKIDVKGENADDYYESYVRPVYALFLNEEELDNLCDGKKVTKEFEDAVTSYVSLNEEEKTFEVIL